MRSQCLECAGGFHSFTECSESSRVFRSIQECSRVYRSVPECAEISRVCKSVPECSGGREMGDRRSLTPLLFVSHCSLIIHQTAAGAVAASHEGGVCV